MQENDYIKATNRAKVSMALTILRDVLICDGCGIEAKRFADVRIGLSRIEEKLFSIIEIDN